MRSVWNGSLSFGLVTIPVKLYSATEDHDISFHQVHKADGGRIRYRRTCEVCGKVVDYADIAKAYDADGRSVIVTDDDFAALPADRSREISVLEFVPAEQIDPLLFDRAYYVEPAATGTKAYVLLRRTLQRSDRVAIVRFALRQRTQLGALRVHGDTLAVQALRWPDEIRAFELPDRVRTATVEDRELRAATTLVDSYATDFDPGKYTDEYQDQLSELIAAKLAGGQAVTATEDTGEGEDAEVLDLLAALERSVARRGGPAAGAEPEERAATGTEGRARAPRTARGGGGATSTGRKSGGAGSRAARPEKTSGAKSAARQPRGATGGPRKRA